MLEYILICCSSVITGIGILKLFRISLLLKKSILIAPMLTLAFWVLSLSWGILFGFPVKYTWQIVLCLTLLLSLYGIFSLRKQIKPFPHKIQFGFIWGLIIILPVLVMRPYFSHGLFFYGGADAPDGWAYITYGQYLWENVRGTEGQLSPLYQFGASLANTRFIASSLLAFLSAVFAHPGDTQYVANLFLAWVLFNFMSACAFFIISQKNIKLHFIYLLLILSSVWILGLLSVNNFDNALILPILPCLAGIINLNLKLRLNWKIIISALLATAFYCYVELFPFILLGALIFFSQYSSKRFNKINFISMGLQIFFFTLLFTLPFLVEGLHFFINQFQAANNPLDSRPGKGMFHLLLIYKHFPGVIWLYANNVFSDVMGSILCLLTGIGIVQLWKEGQRGLILFCGILLSGLLYFILIEEYSYGAYKLLLLNWWLLIFCLVKGLEKILNHTLYKKGAMIAASLFLVIYMNNVYLTQKYYEKYASIKNITPYRNLAQLRYLTHKKGILVSIDDYLNNEWAVYYLRDIPIKLLKYKLYMANNYFYMDRAKTLDLKSINYLLTDAPNSLPREDLVKTIGPYYLWKLSDNQKNMFPFTRIN